jgi:hypothetical protein
MKHNEKSMGAKYQAKEIVKRITVEGEHSYIMIMKVDNIPGKKCVAYLEFFPLMNAPH